MSYSGSTTTPSTVDQELVEVLRHDGWAEVRLNWPARRNALSGPMLAAIGATIRGLDTEPHVHAILLRGNGPDFCSGYFNAPDAVGPHDIDEDIRMLESMQREMLAIVDAHAPVVALVHGRCNAGGTDLAFLCDLVFATDDAQIGFPPLADLGAPTNPMWLYHVGPQWAKRLMFTGDRVSGTDAAHIGLVIKALPADQLEHEVTGLMKRLGRIDKQQLATHKRSVNLGLELMGMRSLLRYGPESNARAHQSPTPMAYIGAVVGTHAADIKQDRLDKFGSGLARAVVADSLDADGRYV